MTTLFVDASAAVAIINREPGYEALEERLVTATRRLYSPMSAWETTVALTRGRRNHLEAARQLASGFFASLDFEMVGVAEQEAGLALQAFDRYGKGRHPARLNMGDCFAYACAKANGAGLLYKGDDFVHTDLGAA